jgi:hypothetical protein
MNKMVATFRQGLLWAFIFFIFSFDLSSSEPVIVFRSDVEHTGYGYRIPALVTTLQGTLLAFAERRRGFADHGENDIVLRRSSDGGKHWEPLQVIADHGKNSLNDPLAIVLSSGRILLLFQEYPYGVHTRRAGWIQEADEGYDGPRNTHSWLVYSDDDGVTWSTPREITRMIRPAGAIAIGSPGIGIQLTHGEYKGRIIVPLYLTLRYGKSDEYGGWANAVAWSDDEGETWHLSNNIPREGMTGYGNEAQVAERSDGSILFVARSQGGYYRQVSVSRDGGVHWSNMQIDFGLPGTPCMGALLAVEGDDGERCLLQSSPANRYARNTGTIRLSTDDGKSWSYAKVVVPGFFAYSCMAPLQEDKVALLYEAERSRTIRLMTLSMEEIMKEKKNEPPYPYLSIPVIDLDKENERQVIIDKEKEQYLGHPTTLLLEDGKTMLTVYPKGHGRGAIVYKRSTDGGLTWSERLPVPASWATSKEVPTLFRTTDKYGKKRIILWSGLYPARLAVSEDDGLTWSGLEPAGIWGGIVVMGCMTLVNTGKGHYMAIFHDDMRFFTRDGRGRYDRDRKAFNSRMFTLYKTFTDDGGLTWTYPEKVMQSREIHICEPGIIRSPDGTRLAALLRENSRRDHSQIIFSDDEGETWSHPRPLPNELTGDRHVLKYAPDGRLVVVFRDHSPREYNEELVRIAREKGETDYSRIAQETGLGSPTEGDWVAWVGTWDDLVKGGKGEYRIRLKDNKDGWDCAYPGLELLPDGTFVTTTYGHWEKGEEPYILSVRFKLEEMDEMRRAQSKR